MLEFVVGTGGSKGERLGRSRPLKPTKIDLFVMILYNSEITFAIKGHFFVHCFVTAVL